MNDNPYAAPAARIAERSRRSKESGNEKNFKAARMNLVLAILNGIAGLSIAAAMATGPGHVQAFAWVVTGAIIAMCGLHLWLWQACKQRRNWARIVSIVMGVLALPAFPIGTLIGVSLLINCWSAWPEPEYYPDSLADAWPLSPRPQ